MSVIRVLRFSLIAIVAMACGSDGISDPPFGFTHAVALAACGPADGPATAIYLSPDPIGSLEPAGVYIRIAVPVDVSHLTGFWPVGLNSESAAWLHLTDPTLQAAESGLVIVKSVGTDNTVTGIVDVDFPNGQRIRGDFTATWLTGMTTCF
jgi:hypothetical protein